MLTLRKFVLICSTLLILNACNKNSEDDLNPNPPITQPPIQKCKLLKGIYYQNDLAVDSAAFVYNDTLIVKTNEASGRYYTFEYSNNNLVKRNHFLKGATQASAYTDFTYNAENNLTAIETYDGTTKVRSYYFSYTSGKLNRVIAKRFSSITGTDIIDYEYTYTYSGENITQATIVQNTGTGSETVIVNYTYDNSENHLKKRTHAFLVEPYYFSKEGTLYPYFFSKNNLTGLVYNSGTNSPHTYLANSSGYLTQIIIGGKVAVRYGYECN